MDDGLAEAFVLAPSKRRAQRSAEVSLQGLRELVEDELLGPAAREAIRCVEQAGADPRLMLLVIEAADEGHLIMAQRNGNGARATNAKRRGA
jgi:hypothetical protein